MLGRRSGGLRMRDEDCAGSRVGSILCLGCMTKSGNGGCIGEGIRLAYDKRSSQLRTLIYSGMQQTLVLFEISSQARQ